MDKTSELFSLCTNLYVRDLLKLGKPALEEHLKADSTGLK